MAARALAIEDKWTEGLVSRLMANNLFNGRSVLVVPNCGWVGHECDLLAITHDLRVVEVEVKISRADLRVDINKDKWWHYRPWTRADLGKPWSNLRDRRVEWPARVWKHYYAVPSEVWRSELIDAIPATSGVLLLERGNPNRISVVRRAKPNRDASKIAATDVVDIARLTSLRLWNALTKETR